MDQIISWLTGYDDAGIQAQIASGADMEAFILNAPRIHENAVLIKGAVCGVRVEDIEDPVTRQIRYLDKLVDELAKGKPMEKILRH